MKTQKNILIAFILNLGFSIFEIIGGFFTGSVAIISDALHDTGDALSIGISYFLEKKSRKHADEKYTYNEQKISFNKFLCEHYFTAFANSFPNISIPQYIVSSI